MNACPVESVGRKLRSSRPVGGGEGGEGGHLQGGLGASGRAATL